MSTTVVCYTPLITSVMKKTSQPKKRFYRTPKGPKPAALQRKKDSSTLPEGYERLERMLAHKGLASRREAKELIAQGLVRVNGTTVYESGFGVLPDTDIVTLRDEALKEKEALLVYKPRGIETSKTAPGNSDIHDRLPALSHLAPIGRLDKESEGLIILSNDGSLARALTKEQSSVEKEYLVEVREQVTPEAVQKLSHGILLDKIKTKPAIVTKRSKTSFTIVLTEGRKHQIRRMCDACHLTIESLTRIRIGHLTVGAMKPGFVKRIPTKDIALLKQ